VDPEWQDRLDLAGTLGGMQEPGIVTGIRRIDEGDELDLYLPERAHIAAAKPARRREFATGRALLRQLIEQDVAIPVGSDRRPVLPDGVVASLSHDDTWAIAARSLTTEFVAVGIDIEPVEPLEPEVAATIGHPDDSDIGGVVRDPHLVFTIKEAAYKAWSSIGGRMLEHHEIFIVTSDRTFSAYVDDLDVIARGSHATAAGRWLALAYIRRD